MFPCARTLAASWLPKCDGQAVGCISAVSYAGRFGFIGLYIVAPAWRGQGVGRRLWAAGMARLAGQVVGLDGVPAQQDYYRRSGFALAWQNVRFAGKGRADNAPRTRADHAARRGRFRVAVRRRPAASFPRRA
jgi:GNAT superfamily N-acetyltransferase